MAPRAIGAQKSLCVRSFFTTPYILPNGAIGPALVRPRRFAGNDTVVVRIRPVVRFTDDFEASSSYLLHEHLFRHAVPAMAFRSTVNTWKARTRREIDEG